MSDEEFIKLYNKYDNNQERSDASGYSPSYISLKASKLGLNKKQENLTQKQEEVVIVIETGKYTRSYLTYESDAEVKAKELRQVIELNDTDYEPKSFRTRKLTSTEKEKELFHIQRLERHFKEQDD